MRFLGLVVEGCSNGSLVVAGRIWSAKCVVA